MKQISVLLLALASVLSALGQKEVPSYGKIDRADLQMTTCDFDPEADACILIKTGETTMSLTGDQPLLQTVYRVRIKILKDKGTGYADIKVRCYSVNRMEEVGNVSGETYNLDAGGNIIKSKLDHSNIFVKQIDKNFSETAFSLPDVKKGSIFEYKYTKISRYFTSIDPWYFQDVIPTRFCQFYMDVPEIFDFTAHQVRSLPVDVKDESAGETRKTYTMKNIPGLRDEPYMSAPRDYLQRLEFQLAGYRFPDEPYHSLRSNWANLNEELLKSDYFGAQLHKNIPHTKALDQQLATIKDSAARMSAVYDYVRQHMNWDGSEGIYSDDGVKTAWEKKSGGTSDINLILVNLLRDAGLKAYPLLVSTRDHGHVNTFYPLLAQFNETLAFVRIGDQGYTLNAADKFNPYRLIPYDVHYTQGYVVDGDTPGWVSLVNENQYKAVAILSGSMDDKGAVTGTARITNYDYSKNQRCKSLQGGMDKFKEAYFTKGNTNIRIDSLTVEGQDNDSMPLQQGLQFTSQLNRSGQYLFYSPNLFMGLEKNPFIAEQRFTDVDFGYTQSYMIVGSLEIPDGYQYETLPKNLKMIMQDTSIVLVRMMQAEGNRISFRISLDFKRPYYLRDEYADFREFYKKLYETLNEPIIIRKKSA
jgi:hypothetical protein